MFIYILSALSFVLPCFSLKLIIPLLSKKLLDSPNQRSSHKTPIPSGGGISFVFFGTIACLFLDFWIPLMSLPLAIFGLIDDVMNISKSIRFIVQIFTVILISSKSPLYGTFLNYGFNSLIEIIFFLFLIVIGTTIINFVNFMDGLDGFVSLNLVIIFFVAILLGQVAILPIAAGVLGFLIWNWSPAKVFMGDIGSTFLGAIFFGIIVRFENPQYSLFLVVTGIPLLGDAFICLIRRLIYGQNIFLPHKSHLYQRLNQAGFSHKNVSLIYSVLTFISGTYIFIFKLNYLPVYFLFIILVYIYMDKSLAIPFKHRSD